MAGFGESCSHVGVLLFYVEAFTKVCDNKIVTQEKTYWILPVSCKEVPYKEIAGIDFTSPGTLRKKFDKRVADNGNPKFKNQKLIARQIMLLMRKCQSFINL